MNGKDAAQHRAHMPQGTSDVLNTRTLASAHKRLAEILSPGMSVLDVGCGSGAITHGIADAVGPGGRVVGLDVNADLVEEARHLHAGVPGLLFEVGNAYDVPYRDVFDIVTAARVLQWLAQPDAALCNMTMAAKPGGRVVVLDYNHEKIVWLPDPPYSMQSFYQAFLRWRSDAGMDNAIADHLAGLFGHAGLREVQETEQHEYTRRGDAGFETQIGIWESVARLRGVQMVEDGFITEEARRAAELDYGEWIQAEAQSQTMYLLCVEGLRS